MNSVKYYFVVSWELGIGKRGRLFRLFLEYSTVVVHAVFERSGVGGKRRTIP